MQGQSPLEQTSLLTSIHADNRRNTTRSLFALFATLFLLKAKQDESFDAFKLRSDLITSRLLNWNPPIRLRDALLLYFVLRASINRNSIWTYKTYHFGNTKINTRPRLSASQRLRRRHFRSNHRHTRIRPTNAHEYGTSSACYGDSRFLPSRQRYRYHLSNPRPNPRKTADRLYANNKGHVSITDQNLYILTANAKTLSYSIVEGKRIVGHSSPGQLNQLMR